MSLTRALIDAEFHDTPIGRCVMMPAPDHLRHAQSCWCLNDSAECCRLLCCCHLSVGDVLTVADSSSISDAVPQWLRRGFVRVVQVLPVVEFIFGNEALTAGVRQVVVHDKGVCHWDGAGDIIPLDLPASPGDVVLVTEPWCETPPTPVRVIHRDGVLGEVET